MIRAKSLLAAQHPAEQVMKTHLVVEIEHEGGTTLRPDTTSELVRAEVEQMLIEISQNMRWEAVTVLLSLRRPAL